MIILGSLGILVDSLGLFVALRVWTWKHLIDECPLFLIATLYATSSGQSELCRVVSRVKAVKVVSRVKAVKVVSRVKTVKAQLPVPCCVYFTKQSSTFKLLNLLQSNNLCSL